MNNVLRPGVFLLSKLLHKEVNKSNVVKPVALSILLFLLGQDSHAQVLRPPDTVTISFGKETFSILFVNIFVFDPCLLFKKDKHKDIFIWHFPHFIPHVAQFVNKAISFGFKFSFLYGIKPYNYETCGKRRHTCICCYLLVCLYHSRYKCFITLKRLAKTVLRKSQSFIFIF